jgi:hypothetical protein
MSRTKSWQQIQPENSSTNVEQNTEITFCYRTEQFDHFSFDYSYYAWWWRMCFKLEKQTKISNHNEGQDKRRACTTWHSNVRCASCLHSYIRGPTTADIVRICVRILCCLIRLQAVVVCHFCYILNCVVYNRLWHNFKSGFCNIAVALSWFKRVLTETDFLFLFQWTTDGQQLPSTGAWPVRFRRYSDRRASRACTRGWHRMFGDRAVPGVSTFYCKFLLSHYIPHLQK